MLEAAKFRVQDTASSGKAIDDVRESLLEQLEVIYSNTPKDDWADNLFLGVAYFLLGERDKVMDCLAVNLDFGYEDKINGMLFAQMEKGSIDSSEAQEVIAGMKLFDLITSMNISDTDSARAVALYFEGNAEALEGLAGTSNNPVVFHALRLLEQAKGSAGDYARVMEYVKRHEALKDKATGAYGEIAPLVKKYADEGRETARVLLGDMYLYGLGVGQDVKKAEEIFSELAKNGNVYAQFVMVQRSLAPVVQSPKAAKTPKATTLAPDDAFALGRKYYYGLGVKTDYKKAAEYLLRAANAGNNIAAFYLGNLYRYGHGVAKSITQARYWYQRAGSVATSSLDDLNKTGR